MKPLLAGICIVLTASTCFAQDGEAKRRAAIDDGLAWLVKQQNKDGSWSSSGVNPSATTAYAGMALLADGSTLERGKNAANLRRALDWYITNAPKKIQYQGLLADPDNPGSTGRYMPEHGVALSFLGQLFLETERPADRAVLRDLLNRAVNFSVAGQNSAGGWFYTSTIEGHDSCENVATMLQLQGLLDARDAGIAVPTQPLKRAYVHLTRCTTIQGGISYSGQLHITAPPAGGGRPIITAMALAACLSKGGPYNDDVRRKWLSSCAEGRPFAPELSDRYFDLLLPYYFGKVVFHLDEDAWREAFPEKKMPDHLKWVNYRKVLFADLYRFQANDGSFGKGQGWGQGPVFQTSLALNILLYEDTQTAPWHPR